MKHTKPKPRREPAKSGGESYWWVILLPLFLLHVIFGTKVWSTLLAAVFGTHMTAMGVTLAIGLPLLLVSGIWLFFFGSRSKRTLGVLLFAPAVSYVFSFIPGKTQASRTISRWDREFMERGLAYGSAEMLTNLNLLIFGCAFLTVMGMGFLPSWANSFAKAYRLVVGAGLVALWILGAWLIIAP